MDAIDGVVQQEDEREGGPLPFRVAVNRNNNPTSSSQDIQSCSIPYQVNFTCGSTPSKHIYAMVRNRTSMEITPSAESNSSTFKDVENFVPENLVIKDCANYANAESNSPCYISRQQISQVQPQCDSTAGYVRPNSQSLAKIPLESTLSLQKADSVSPLRSPNSLNVDVLVRTRTLYEQSDDGLKANKRRYSTALKRMCGIDGCGLHRFAPSSRCLHFQTEHNLSTYISKIFFSSKEDFKIFLKELSDGGCSFRKTDKKKELFGTYKCNRIIVSRTPMLRIVSPSRGNVSSYYDAMFECCDCVPPPVMEPFIREGGECPAFLSAKEFYDSVIVYVCDWHLHGPIIPKRLLQKIENLYVAKKMPVSAVKAILQATTEEFCEKGSELDRHIRILRETDVQFLCHYVVNSVHYIDNARSSSVYSNSLTNFERMCKEQHTKRVQFGTLPEDLLMPLPSPNIPSEDADFNNNVDNLCKWEPAPKRLPKIVR